MNLHILLLITSSALAFAEPIPITGRMRDATGAGVDAAEVSLRVASTPHAPPATVKTDKDGRFAIVAPRHGEYELSIRSPGFISLRTTVAAFGESIDIGDLPLTVTGGDTVEIRRIVGHIVDPTGAPIYSTGVARLRINGYSTTNPSYIGKGGDFRFLVTAGNRYELELQIPGFRLFKKTIQDTGAADIDFGTIKMELGKDYPQVIVTPRR